MSIQENYTSTLEKYQGEQENCWYFYNMTQKEGCGVISLIAFLVYEGNFDNRFRSFFK